MTCNSYYIAVGIAEPEFAVVGCWVDEGFTEDLRTQRSRLFDNGIEVFDFKP